MDFVVTLNNMNNLFLDGRDSYDEDNDMIHFSWFVAKTPENGQATIEEPHSPITAFSVDGTGTYWFSLIVNDEQTKSRPAIIQVTVQDNHSSPVAIITGPDQGSLEKEILLSGENSYDLENNPLQFSWQIEKLPKESQIKKRSGSLSLFQFKPDVGGDYVVSLTVTDQKRKSSTQKHLVVIKEVSDSLIDLIVDPDQILSVGESRLVTAQITGQPKENPYHLNWELVSRPSASQTSLQVLREGVEITPDVPGHYLIRVFLKKNERTILYKTIHVSATLNRNNFFLFSEEGNNNNKEDHVYADAGPDIEECFDPNKSVSVHSKNSYSSLSNELKYHWEVTESPKESEFHIDSEDSANAQLTVNKHGRYKLQLEVTDINHSLRSTDQVTIRFLQDKMRFEVADDYPWENKSAIPRSSYGIKVFYGDHPPLSQWKEVYSNKIKLNIDDESPTAGNEMLISNDFIVTLSNFFQLDKIYYLTYSPWHVDLGTAGRDTPPTVFQFIKKRIGEKECYEIKEAP